MKIVTWNVNSIRARLENVLAWLDHNTVDVLLLQEIKCVDEQFPTEFFEDRGFNVVTFGQKTYNGVTCLSKYPIEDVQKNIPDFDDEQARYLEVVTNNKRIISVYVPNGFEVGHEKYTYKLSFLKALQQHLERLYGLKEEIIIGGDFNIAPHDMDTYDPKKWKDRILCSQPERFSYQGLLNIGYLDAFRFVYPERQQFTWWDYRKNSYENNFGLRIDHFLISPEVADYVQNVYVDEKIRTQEKASDHAPVFLVLK